MAEARALILIDLQNEFLSEGGAFPIHQDARRFLANVSALVPAFRQTGNGHIYWIKSEYRHDVPLEEEPGDDFLTGTHKGRNACCEPGSPGADFAPQAVTLIVESDKVITKTWYSAFKETELESDLRSKGISEILVGGLITNVCVQATVNEAIRLGFSVGVVSDCLGWRNESSHHRALEKMKALGAEIVTSRSLMPSSTRNFKSKDPVLGAGDVMGEGDTSLMLNILPKELEETAFERLKEEVAWQTMYHRGGEVPRLVAVEGQIEDDGSFPIYRHPSDESPPLLQFSPTVAKIRKRVEEVLKHPVNHVLIQYYRSGHDYISEHSDKTIDIVRGSNIVNVSLGAERTMILRTKRDAANAKAETEDSASVVSGVGTRRPGQRVPLPHNSMFILGQQTNAKWLHSIRQDKRLDSLKSPAELAFDGERISLTFRHIGTFLSADESRIYGQGATAKDKENARPVINGSEAEAEKMIVAFGQENQRSDFDWDATYGEGFDVLHFKARLPKLYYVNGSIPSWRVQMALHEKGVEFSQTRLKVMTNPKETRLPAFLALNPRGKTPVFVDVDRECTKINESLAILTYIETYYTQKPLLPPLEQRAHRALVLARTQETENLHSAYDALEDGHFDAANSGGALSDVQREALIKTLEREITFWEGYASKTKYIAGEEFTLADCAFYPILAYMLRRGLELEQWPNLKRYYETVWARESRAAEKAQPEGWVGRGKVNVFKGTRGGAKGLYGDHTPPTAQP